MPLRDFYLSGTNIANVGTSWQDMTPVMASGQGVLMTVRFVNRTTSSTASVDAALRNSSNAVDVYIIPRSMPVLPGETLEFTILVPPARKLSVMASAANVIDAVIADAIIQT